MFPKQALDLACGQADAVRQLAHVRRFRCGALHEPDDFLEFRTADGTAGVRLQSLMILAPANLRMDELLGDGHRNAGCRCLADEMQHHVERGRAARAGEHAAIHHVQLAADLERGMPRAEQVRIFPVHRAAAAGEQSGVRQNERAAADGADHRAAAGEAPQVPVHPVAAAELRRLEPRAHDQHVGLAQLGQGLMRRNADAVAGSDLAAVDRYQPPVEQMAFAHPIGRA